MSSLRLMRKRPVEIHTHAIDNLQYIRQAMEGASAFTAVPGLGGIAMGITALVAAAVAARQSSTAGWVLTWLAAALVAFGIGLFAMVRKARTADMTLFSQPGRKFVLGFSPPMLAAALLTFSLYRAGLTDVLPGTWLLLYGVGVLAAGTFSVRVVPAMGVCFMAVGTAALFSPASWGNWFLAGGFGVLQIVFGIIIAWRYGG